MKPMRNPRRAAFTLIELLVVILILAVLAAMIVPRIIGRGDDAKQAKAVTDLKALGSMLDTYKLDVGRYPTTEENLDALRNPPADAEGWKGPYTAKAIPFDPWGNPYQYEWPGPYGDDSVYLYSFGADGTEGGEGDGLDIFERGGE